MTENRETKEIRLMRSMAWERAKGELKSIFHSYWNDDGRFEKFKTQYEEFVKKVEDYGLHE